MPPYSTVDNSSSQLLLVQLKEKVEDVANTKTDVTEPQLEKYKFLFWEFETPFIWPRIIFLTMIHLVGVYGLLTHSYIKEPGIVVYSCIVCSLGGFGVTAGAHRYWTHKTFKAKLPLRIILIICYTISGQNSIYKWVKDHRVHHKYSETDADPHNSNRGFFFSHVGWLMMRKHPEVIKKGRQIDCTDILEDPLVAFHEKHFQWFKWILGFFIPISLAPLIYGETWYNSIMGIAFIRYTFNLNFTWLVNSAAHIYGTRPYDVKIRPRENNFVSLVALGEGYHNYHHTFPWDYRAAELGSRINVTTFWLNIFEKIGWAYDLKSPSIELVRKVTEKNGDGSHYKWGHEVPIEENDRILEESKKSM